MRKIVFYKDYFMDFYNKQTSEVQVKIEWTLGIIRDLNGIPSKFLKQIKGINGLYEIRVHCGSNIFRIFSCFDKGNIVILFNGYQKKSQKAPQKEIKMANKLMKEYFSEK